MLKKVSKRIINSQSSGTKKMKTATSLSNLLHDACVNIGMGEYDTTTLESRLRDDWFFEAEHLKGLSIDALSRYMPYRLAQEVIKSLH